MGLDLVELVMETEEAFGIVISDEAAGEIRTAGDLCEYVLSQRRLDGCPTAQAFREIRRLLVEALGIAPRTVRPSTELESLLPRCLRHRVWRLLSRQYPCHWKRLRLSPWIGRAVALVPLVAAAFVLAQTRAVAALPFAGLVALGIWLLVWISARPLAVCFPSGLVTVGDVAIASLPANCDEVARSPLEDEEVWRRLQKIVAGNLGVDVEEVTRAARFVEDLGAG